MAVDASTQEKIRKYVLRARQTLETGKLVIAHMDERHNADYELELLSYETATENLSHAERFVMRVEEVLAELGALL